MHVKSLLGFCQVWFQISLIKIKYECFNWKGAIHSYLKHTCKNLIPMVVTRAMANSRKNYALLMCRIWKMGWNLFSSLDIRKNPRVCQIQDLCRKKYKKGILLWCPMMKTNFNPFFRFYTSRGHDFCSNWPWPLLLPSEWDFCRCELLTVSKILKSHNKQTIFSHFWDLLVF